eukprot:m.5665 g.5665  ORF g.5665 m.5665 type:complete len:170 (-) comp2446_c0_seq2:809-1318(-)
MGDNGNGEDKNESGTKNGERNHDNDNNKKSTTSTEEKSLFWTFLRFVFGGLFGMHHFYLNRDFQAVIWTATFGGFGIGLLYDFFFLTRYVEIANEMAASKKLFNFSVFGKYHLELNNIQLFHSIRLPLPLNRYILSTRAWIGYFPLSNYRPSLVWCNCAQYCLECGSIR